ncbi:MAG: sigma-E factor negative regulatory protein [Pseudomonadales bacterium]
MTDKSKESLSALLDEEASEFEVHQLLRGFNSDESLKGSWLTYQQVRAVVRGEKSLTSDQHRHLHTRISQAVAAEGLPEFGSQYGPLKGRSFVKPAAGIAVAASLVLASFFVLQTAESPEPTRGMVDSERRAPTQAIPAQTVSNQMKSGSDNWATRYTGEDVELTELDDEKQRRLREYLNQHDRMVRMNPNARMVMFENSASE